MTDDTPPLIERARAWAGMMKGEYSDEGESLILDLCEALSSLTVSPLPEEIAGLIERLTLTCATVQRWHDAEVDAGERAVLAVIIIHMREAATALERMAREIAEKDRLREKAIAHYTAVIGDQAARIRELEAEVKRDREAFDRLTAAHHENVAKWRERISELEAERDAIQAKTIEECATAKITLPPGQFATASDDFLRGFQAGAEAQIDAIRALMSAGDGNPPSPPEEKAE